MEDALDKTVCFALCVADAKLLLCWDVRAGLTIPVPSLHSPWSPRWLQIWHKGPSYPERPQLEADGDILLYLHLFHPICLGPTLGHKADSKHHPSQSPEAAC